VIPNQITPPDISNSSISPDCFVDLGVRITKSNLESNVKCYKFSHIVESKIGTNSIIGDLSKIDNCVLGSYNKIEKYNHLYHTILGNYSYTGPYSVIMHCSVGKFTSISWGTTLGGAEHDYERVTSHALLYNSFFDLNQNIATPYNRFEKPCNIGHDVWIGANSTILRGVTVGNGAVIAANALVNKDVPPYAIVAGTPAKIIKFRIEDHLIPAMQEIEWWHFPHHIIQNHIAVLNQKISDATIDDLFKVKQQTQQKAL